MENDRSTDLRRPLRALRSGLRAGTVVPLLTSGVFATVARRQDAERDFDWWRDTLLDAAARLDRDDTRAFAEVVRRSVRGHEPDFVFATKVALHGLNGTGNDTLGERLNRTRSYDSNDPRIREFSDAVWGLGSRLVIVEDNDLYQTGAQSGAPSVWHIAPPPDTISSLRTGLERRAVWHLRGHIANPWTAIPSTTSSVPMFPNDESRALFVAGRRALKSLARVRSLLLIGFNLFDSDTDVQLESYRDILDSSVRTHFALARRFEPQRLRARDLPIEIFAVDDLAASLTATGRPNDTREPVGVESTYTVSNEAEDPLSDPQFSSSLLDCLHGLCPSREESHGFGDHAESVTAEAEPSHAESLTTPAVSDVDPGSESSAVGVRTGAADSFGLGSTFEAYCRERWPDSEGFRRVRGALEVLVAARDAVPIDLLATALGVPESTALELVRRGPAGVAVERDGAVAFADGGFAGWLADASRAGGDFWLDRKRGNERLARSCFAQYLTSSGRLSSYCREHMVGHLAESGLWGHVDEVLTDVVFLDAKLTAGLAAGLVSDYVFAQWCWPVGDDAISEYDSRGLALAFERLQRWRALVERRVATLATGEERIAPLVYNAGMRDANGFVGIVSASSPLLFGRPWARRLRETHRSNGSAGVPSRINSLALTPDGARLIAGTAERAVRVWRLGSEETSTTFGGDRHGRLEYRAPHAQVSSFRLPPLQLLSMAATPDGRLGVSGHWHGATLVWDTASQSVLRTLDNRRSTCVAISPDGKRAVTGSREHTLLLWDLDSGQTIATFETQRSRAKAIAITPDGTRVIVACTDRTLRILDFETLGSVAMLEGHQINDVVISADGRRALAVGEKDILKIWDLTTGEHVDLREGSRRNLNLVAVDAAGHRALTVANDRLIKVWDLELGTVSATLEGHSQAIRAVAITPDGRRAISSASDSALHVWDLATRRCLARFEDRDRTFKVRDHTIDALAITSDGKTALSGRTDGTVGIWDLTSADILPNLQGHTGSATSVAISSDGRRAISSSDDGSLRVWDLECGSCTATLEGHLDGVTSVAMTSDDRLAVSGSVDRSLLVWDLETGRSVARLEGHSQAVTCVAISPNGDVIVSGSSDGTVRLWEASSRRCVATFDDHRSGVNTVAVCPDSKRALSGDDDGTLRLWDLAALRCEAVEEDLGSAVNAIAVSPNGQTVVLGCRDGEIRAYDLTLRRLDADIGRHPGAITGVAFSSDSGWMVSSGSDRMLRIWNVDSGECLAVFDGHQSGVNGVAIAFDGKRVVSASSDTTLRTWSPGVCRRRDVKDGHSSSVLAVAVTPGGRHALSGSADGTIRVWDLMTGRCEGVLNRHWGWVTAVALVPDANRAVTVGTDGLLRVWDLSSRQCVSTIDGDSGWLQSVAPVNDGRQALTGGADGTVRLWDLETRECLALLEGHSGPVNAVAVARDGSLAVSCGDDATVRIWDLKSRGAKSVLRGHRSSVRAVAMTADDRHAITGGDDGTLRVWDIEGLTSRIVDSSIEVGISALALSGTRVVVGSTAGEIAFFNLEGLDRSSDPGSST